MSYRGFTSPSTQPIPAYVLNGGELNPCPCELPPSDKLQKAVELPMLSTSAMSHYWLTACLPGSYKSGSSKNPNDTLQKMIMRL